MYKYLKFLEPLTVFVMFVLIVGTYYITINLNPATATAIQVASVLGAQAYPMIFSEISTNSDNQIDQSFLTYNYKKDIYIYNLKFNDLPAGTFVLPIIQIKYNGSSGKQSFVVSPSISPQVQNIEIDLYIDGEKYPLYTLTGDLLSPTVVIQKEGITTAELRFNNHTEIFLPLELKLNWR